MCFGATIVFRCCGRTIVSVRRRCDLAQPYPEGHSVFGYQFSRPLCKPCQSLRWGIEDSDRLEDAREQKAMMEFSRGERVAPNPLARLTALGERTNDVVRMRESPSDGRARGDWRDLLFNDWIDEESDDDDEDLNCENGLGEYPPLLRFVSFHEATSLVGYPGPPAESVRREIEVYVRWISRPDVEHGPDDFLTQLTEVRNHEHQNFEVAFPDFSPSFRQWLEIGLPDFEVLFLAAGDAERAERWDAAIAGYQLVLAEQGTPHHLRVFNTMLDHVALNRRNRLSGLAVRFNVTFFDWMRSFNLRNPDFVSPQSAEASLETDLVEYEVHILRDRGTQEQLDNFHALREAYPTNFEQQHPTYFDYVNQLREAGIVDSEQASYSRYLAVTADADLQRERQAEQNRRLWYELSPITHEPIIVEFRIVRDSVRQLLNTFRAMPSSAASNAESLLFPVVLLLTDRIARNQALSIAQWDEVRRSMADAARLLQPDRPLPANLLRRLEDLGRTETDGVGSSCECGYCPPGRHHPPGSYAPQVNTPQDYTPQDYTPPELHAIQDAADQRNLVQRQARVRLLQFQDQEAQAAEDPDSNSN